MPRGARLFLLGLLLAVQTGCAPSVEQPRVARGGLPRVMSLNPCLDAILLEVADPDQILSLSHYSLDPRSSSTDVARARRFAANFETAEEVVAARPDIVLAGPHVAAATQAAIRSVGVHIVSLGVPATVEESREQIRALASAVGQRARGEALVARIDTALAVARPARGGRPVAALIRQGDGLVPGTGTLVDDLLARTGFHNKSRDYHLAMWDILPLEVMMADPPRLLLTDLSADHAGSRVPGGAPALRTADFPARLFQCAGPNLIEASARLAAIRRRMTGA